MKRGKWNKTISARPFFIVPLILLAGLSLTIHVAKSGDENEKRKKIMEVIDEEISEVVRLTKHLSNDDPVLLLRLAELSLEKARLINEEESERFVQLPIEERQKVNKDKFYAQSRKYYKKAEDIGLFLLKRHPNVRDKDKIYFILAYNSKEINQFDKAKDYLEKAVESAKEQGHGSIQRKSMLALAEMHYNEGAYEKALPLYRNSLGDSPGENDKWWTKDTYNYAWTAYNLGHFDLALARMKKAYQYSQKGEYVDVSRSVEKNIAPVFVSANMIDEGMAFYGRIGQKITPFLITAAQSLTKANKFTFAENILNRALPLCEDQNEKLEVSLQLLKLYEQFGKYKEHYQVTKKIFEVPLEDIVKWSGKDDLIQELQKSALQIHRSLAAGPRKGPIEENVQKAMVAVYYFKALLKLGVGDPYKVNFVLGELHFFIEKDLEASSHYREAYDEALKRNDEKVSKAALDGILAIVERNDKMPFEVQAFAMEKYLQREKDPVKRKKIVKNLFSLQLKMKDSKKMEMALVTYIREFGKEPDGMENVEKMMALLLDQFKAENNRPRSLMWIEKVDKGVIRVRPDFKDKLAKFTYAVEFENIEKSNKEGLKGDALKGHWTLYHDPHAPMAVKKTSAYNLLILFYELGETENIMKWAKESLQILSPEEVVQYESTYQTVANDLFYRQEHMKAAEVADMALSKTCQTNNKSSAKNNFFANAVILYSSESNPEKVKSVLVKGEKCGIGQQLLNQHRVNYLKLLSRMKRWKSLHEEVDELIKNSEYGTLLIEFLNDLRIAYQKIGRADMAQESRMRIIQAHAQLVKAKRPLSYEVSDIMANIKLEELKSMIDRAQSSKLQFPENYFNEMLKKKFDDMDRITTLAKEVLQIGSGQGIVQSYTMLYGFYDDLGNEIKEFTPEGKSEDYVKSFKASMEKITKQIFDSSAKYKAELRQQIERNKIMSPFNNAVLFPSLPIAPEFPAVPFSFMDRGGVH